jgi:hypothetical protein
LKHEAFRRWIISLLIGACVPVLSSAQSSATQHKTKIASQDLQIVRAFIEDPIKDSGYETGPLHILYSDGTEVIKDLPPLERSTQKEVVFNDVAFTDVQLAEDRQTIGWTINVENCCTSYSIPMRVVVLRGKNVLHSFAPGPMIWGWMFVQGGARVALVVGPTHGPEVGDYQLYDVTTGKLISEVWGDEDTQALKPKAPAWAVRLQDHLHNR